MSLGGATRSAVPLMIRPDDGQGARKVKSYMFAGGEALMKPVISGRRISSCIPIQAPKLNPATQQCLEFWFMACRKSSALAASESSPMPWSYSPCERPTPRKLNRRTVNPSR